MSKIYDKIYYSNLRYFNINENGVFDEYSKEIIMYRIILLDDCFLFAEEIATGCFFPIATVDNSGYYRRMFKDFSGLRVGNFFIEGRAKPNGNLGKISFDEEYQQKIAYYLSTEEINEYLKSRKNDESFKSRMISYAICNKYLWEEKIIRDAIAKLNNSTKIESNTNSIPIADIAEITSFGFDLSAQEDLCHAIGREQELEKIIESTVIKGKSILLIGDSGSGKTALVEELARQIKFGTNPWLNNKMIISINANSLVVGTKYRGMFEENMQKLVLFARKNKGKVILFIDEIHSLYSLGESEDNKSNDAMNILKPYISNRDVVIIGATTTHEYSKYLVPDEAFCSRFDKITIRPLALEQLIDILREFMEKLQERYGIFYSFSNLQDLLTRVISLTDLKHQVSYNEVRVSNIRLAKDVLEDAFVHAKYIGKEVITEKDVLEALTKCERLSSVLRDNLALELNDMVEPTEREWVSGTKVIPFMRKLVNPNESK